MEEEYNLCEVPKADIEKYAEMVYALNKRADDIAGEMRKFLSRYGKDVREIQSNIGNHLDGCFSCSDYYKQCLEDEVGAERLARGIAVIEGKENEGKAFSEKREEWGVEHSAYENPENLRNYLFKKSISFVKNKPFELSLELERHIESCNNCKEVYNLELDIIKEARKNG